MTYFTELKRAMEFLAQDDKTIFIGYNAKNSGRANGTLKDVPDHQIIETPVAENLMVGMALGMSLEGFKPVVWIERFDFILNAMDAIVNHLDKYRDLSEGQFQPKMIIRTMIGKRCSPLFSGCTHTQDFTDQVQSLVHFPVVKLTKKEHVFNTYTFAHSSPESFIIVEDQDLYNT